MAYGTCPECGNMLQPVWFTEWETVVREGFLYKTGRWRIACSHLVCESCGKPQAVDDTFDREWHTGRLV